MENKRELEQRISAAEKELAEMRKLLNQPPIDITERVKNYNDILELSGVRESADDVKIDGFDAAENKVVKTFIKKMRIAKIYNEGWLPRRGDQRWYPWYNVSSGFVFDDAVCGGTGADAGSASRLCLKNRKLTEDYGKKFKDIECDFIDLR